MLQQATPLTAEPSQGLRQEFRATLALAVPLAAANLLQMLVHAIDVIFVARLGDAALAASSLGVAIFGLLLWTGSASPDSCAYGAQAAPSKVSGTKPGRRSISGIANCCASR